MKTFFAIALVLLAALVPAQAQQIARPTQELFRVINMEINTGITTATQAVVVLRSGDRTATRTVTLVAGEGTLNVDTGMNAGGEVAITTMVGRKVLESQTVTIKPMADFVPHSREVLAVIERGAKLKGLSQAQIAAIRDCLSEGVLDLFRREQDQIALRAARAKAAADAGPISFN